MLKALGSAALAVALLTQAAAAQEAESDAGKTPMAAAPQVWQGSATLTTVPAACNTAGLALAVGDAPASIYRPQFAASEPKSIHWYEGGHEFTDPAALLDRLEWLEKRLTLKPVRTILNTWPR